MPRPLACRRRQAQWLPQLHPSSQLININAELPITPFNVLSEKIKCASLMAEEPRRSTRERRIRRDSSYYYDEKVFSALSNTNNTIGDNRQIRDQCESNSV